MPDRRPTRPGAASRVTSGSASYDLVDRGGRIIRPRRPGHLDHLGIRAAHARCLVLAIADEREVTVVALKTGEVLSTHAIEPARSYWRNQRRDPGRWPGSQATGWRRGWSIGCRRCPDSMCLLCRDS